MPCFGGGWRGPFFGVFVWKEAEKKWKEEKKGGEGGKKEKVPRRS